MSYVRKLGQVCVYVCVCVCVCEYCASIPERQTANFEHFDGSKWCLLCRLSAILLFQCPRGLMRGFATTRLVGLLVRIPPGTKMSLLSVVCCQVDVRAWGRSLVERSLTECGVSECDR